MKVFILPFGEIRILDSNIAELIINEGVLIDDIMIDTYRTLLQSHLSIPFSLLINKKNAYSYTFAAQMAMGNSNHIVDLRAVVVYSQSAEMATNIVMNINQDNNCNIKIFREREAAVDWLLKTQNNKSRV